MATKPGLDERDARFDKLREAMAGQGFDALILAGKGHWWWGRGFFRYLTDFHLWGHDGLILFPLEGEPMLSLSSGGVARRIAGRGWITETHGDVDVAPTVVEAMKRRGLTHSKVGIAGHKRIISYDTYAMLAQGVPDVTFVNADDMMERVRAAKSPLEIQQNRELWTVAKTAMERYYELLAPGKSQWELAAEATKTAMELGGRDILIYFNGRPPEDMPIVFRDLLGYHMEIEGPSGHWCELSINTVFRQPTDLEARLMASELRAYEKIRGIAKPGAKLAELAATFERVLVEDGWTLHPDQPGRNDFHNQGMDVIEWPVYGTADQRGGRRNTRRGHDLLISSPPSSYPGSAVHGDQREHAHHGGRRRAPVGTVGFEMARARVKGSGR